MYCIPLTSPVVQMSSCHTAGRSATFLSERLSKPFVQLALAQVLNVGCKTHSTGCCRIVVACRTQAEPHFLRLAPIAGVHNTGPMLLFTLKFSKCPITIAIEIEIMELQIPFVSSNASHHINAVATVLNTNI